jgi:hypothetical protein
VVGFSRHSVAKVRQQIKLEHGVLTVLTIIIAQLIIPLALRTFGGEWRLLAEPGDTPS